MCKANGLISLSVALLASTAINARPASAEAISLPPVVSSFAATATALAKSASDEIDIARSKERVQAIRKALTTKLIDPSVNGTSKITLNDVLNGITLLCEPRRSHIAHTTKYNYMNAVVARIDAVSKQEPATDLISSISLLFSDYSVSVSEVTLKEEAISKLQERADIRCKTDLRSFDEAYYGAKIQAPAPVPAAAAAPVPAGGVPSLSFLGPIGAMVDTFVAIFTPVVVGGSNLIDEAKRRQAIVEFLSESKNQQAIKTVGLDLSKRLSKFTFDKRRSLAASFIEQQFVIRNKTIDLSKIEACKDLAADRFKRADGDGGAPHATFMLCWRAAWNEIAETSGDLLKTGDAYDRLADAGDTDSATQAFEEISKDLNAIKQGAVTDPKALWAQVSKLIAFVKTVKEALSKENQEKMRAAIDGLVKS
jgi:hypothetical protein